MFIIKSGQVKIVIPGQESEMELATINPEDFLGELALLDDTPRSASAKAVEKTEALAFFREGPERACRNLPRHRGQDHAGPRHHHRPAPEGFERAAHVQGAMTWRGSYMSEGQNQPVHRISTRMLTRRIVFTITAAVAVLTIIGLVWALRPIVLPFIIGTLVAYICFPLLKLFTRRGIPRGAGILLMFAVFFAVVTLIVNQLGSIIPDERDSLVLRTRFQYKLNERYRAYMGLDQQGQKGSVIYQFLGPDLDTFMDNINTMIRLNKDDQALFMKYREGYKGLPKIKDQYFDYFQKNMEKYPAVETHPTEVEKEKEKEKAELQAAATDPEHPQSRLSSMMAAIKIWIITPLVFLFPAHR